MCPSMGRGGFSPPTMGGLGPPRGGPGAGRGMPMAPAAGGPAPTAPLPPGATAAKPRTEFIVMFFWREPTPSDQLMNLGGAAAPGR